MFWRGGGAIKNDQLVVFGLRVDVSLDKTGCRDKT